MMSSLEETKWLIKEWLSNMDAMSYTFQKQADEIMCMFTLATANKLLAALLKGYKIFESFAHQVDVEMSCVKETKEILKEKLEVLEKTNVDWQSLKKISDDVLDAIEELYYQILKAKHDFINTFYSIIRDETHLPTLDLTKIVLVLLENVEDCEDAAHIVMTQLEPAVNSKFAEK